MSNVLEICVKIWDAKKANTIEVRITRVSKLVKTVDIVNINVTLL